MKDSNHILLVENEIIIAIAEKKDLEELEQLENDLE